MRASLRKRQDTQAPIQFKSARINVKRRGLENKVFVRDARGRELDQGYLGNGNWIQFTP